MSERVYIQAHEALGNMRGTDVRSFDRINIYEIILKLTLTVAGSMAIKYATSPLQTWPVAQPGGQSQRNARFIGHGVLAYRHHGRFIA